MFLRIDVDSVRPAVIADHREDAAGLLLSERHGKWTYYRRNEETICEFVLNLGLDI